jgi:hypothetical protein
VSLAKKERIFFGVALAPLFVGAMVTARYNPHLNSFRDKLVAAGKSKLVALIAVARKLTTILNASFEIDAHGSQSPLEQQDSRSLLYPAKSVSWVLTLDTRFLSSDRSVWGHSSALPKIFLMLLLHVLIDDNLFKNCRIFCGVLSSAVSCVVAIT